MLPKIKLWLGMLTAGLAFASTQAHAYGQLNMPLGVTEISRETYDLHMTIIWICVGIGVVVFGVLLWSMIFHRKSRNPKPSTFHEHTGMEILWTVIPFIILVSMAIPATRVLTEIYDASEAEMDIMVTGYQWRWQYEYLDDEGEPVSYFSNMATSQEEIYNLMAKDDNYLLEVDEPLVIPINTKVRFLLTSADVIHSWWVPEFAVKKDAIPGFVNESWTIVEEPGIYRGQCTELCGQDHAFMPVVVRAVEQEEFDAWYAQKQEEAAAVAELANQEWTLADLMERGQTVYNSYCLACHQAEGQGLPPAFPALVGSEVALGPIETHADVVINGVPGTAMAAFGEQLNPVDLAAVITFERNAWGNDVGDMITPVEILELQAQAE